MWPVRWSTVLKAGEGEDLEENHRFGVPRSFAMLPSAPSPECEPPAGPISPRSVEGAVKHILRRVWGPPPPPPSLTRRREGAPYRRRRSSPLADLAAPHFGWGRVFSPRP